MAGRTHPAIEYVVEDSSGHERSFSDPQAAQVFAVTMAMSYGKSNLDVLIFSPEGAYAYGGDDAVARYEEDPEASVFDRFEIRVNHIGSVP
jgi:hypothetical protein